MSVSWFVGKLVNINVQSLEVAPSHAQFTKRVTGLIKNVSKLFVDTNRRQPLKDGTALPCWMAIRCVRSPLGG